MSGRGKRIRPLILILTCAAFGGNIENALDAAIAIEILHNFTLVHDDIMDNADTRRSKETIHKKWDVSTAILVGDELIGLSYRSLLNTNSNRIEEIVKAFTNGVIDVCEGQALDNQFENRANVNLDDYMVMIEKKTAELLMISSVIGALIADASEKDIQIINEYSLNLGLAFQIHDDLLDVIADEKKFGKKIGGDILERKKTFLYLKSIESGNYVLTDKLTGLYESNDLSRVNEVIIIYKELNIIEQTISEIKKYTELANRSLLKLQNVKASSLLKYFADMLLNRGY